MGKIRPTYRAVCSSWPLATCLWRQVCVGVCPVSGWTVQTCGGDGHDAVVCSVLVSQAVVHSMCACECHLIVGSFVARECLGLGGHLIRISACRMCRLRMQGSPTLAACWRDESDNKVLKAIAQTSHSAVFHSRVLATWRLHSSRASLKRKAQDVRSNKKRVCVMRESCAALWLGPGPGPECNCEGGSGEGLSKGTHKPPTVTGTLGGYTQQGWVYPLHWL